VRHPGEPAGAQQQQLSKQQAQDGMLICCSLWLFDMHNMQKAFP